MNKLLNIDQLDELRVKWRDENKMVVFTNGCFDIIHSGHIELLTKAKAQGDILVLGLNSDASVRLIKEKGRPIVGEIERIKVLSALEMIDYIIVFEEQTPLELITRLVPDVLVKGSDWSLDKIVGREVVESHGGKVVRVELVEGMSTTNIIKKIVNAYCK